MVGHDRVIEGLGYSRKQSRLSKTMLEHSKGLLAELLQDAINRVVFEEKLAANAGEEKPGVERMPPRHGRTFSTLLLSTTYPYKS